MKTFSLKGLGALIFAAGLVVAGVAAPANAATMNVTAVASGGTVGTTGTNAFPISLTFAAVTAGSDNMQVVLPSGWTFVNFQTICNNTTINSQQVGIVCHDFDNTSVDFDVNGAYTTGTTVAVEFAVGSINTGTNRVFTVNAKVTGNTQDTGTASLAGGVSSSTVNFMSNGAGVSPTSQTASGVVALNLNSFTRSGYAFAGWATSTTGPVVYLDGANYDFATGTTLYAVWTPTLANTGINTGTVISLLAGGMSLALVGLVIFMTASRKRNI